MKGLIFNIIYGSTEDGKGLRTVVYLKGCKMKCPWCHNPEGQSFCTEILFYRHKCTNCGICNTSFKNCPNKALVLAGEEIDSQKLLKILLKYKSYYNASGGGVTFSGGECLEQFDFLFEMLKLCKENHINTAIESAFYSDWEKIYTIIPYVDCFLVDLKHINNKLHLQATGFSNHQIIKNIKKISKMHSNIVLRIPLIPNFSDTAENREQTLQFAKKLNILNVEFLPFNATAENKYNACGRVWQAEEFKGG